MRHLIHICIFAFSAISAADLKGKVELGAFGGGVSTTNLNNALGQNHGIFGFSAGYGVGSGLQIYGEHSYVALGQNQSVSVRLRNFSGGVKINLAKSARVDPYGLVGLGASTFSSDECCTSGTDLAMHFGGGVRVYARSKKWGVVPEFRWTRIFTDQSPTDQISYTGGIFFQWGR